MASAPLRVVHVITTLHVGGAEKLLAALLPRWRDGFDPSVLCLADEGVVAEEIRALGVPVACLGLDGGWRGAPGALRRYLRWRAGADRAPPGLLVGWMYHGDALATRLWRRWRHAPGLVWTIHQTPAPDAPEKPLTRRIIAHLARRARDPDATVYVAHASRAAHAGLGFGSPGDLVIENGVDTERFRPDPGAGASLRAELGLPPDARLIGRFARFDPMKDFDTCLAAFARLLAARPDATPPALVLAGADVDAAHPPFRALLARHGFADGAGAGRVFALGRRNDMPRLQAGVDFATSTSCMKEAAPLALTEAMACGTPCVATDVGDSGRIVEGVGRLVPTRDPEALAAVWAEWLAWPRERLAAQGMAARRRMEAYFSLDATAVRYADVFRAAALRRDGNAL